MSARSIFLQHRSLRWIVPAGVVGAVVLAAVGTFSASADVNLPPRTAAQLLVDLNASTVDGLSGTVVSNAKLGLPDVGGLAGSAGNLSPLSLITGSHTARVWYAGPTKQRIALLDPVGEYDVFHNGTDVWQWSSSDRLATHSTLPAGAASMTPDKTAAALTPDQLAKQALAAIDPTTVVSTRQGKQVAGHDAYQLVLTPRDTSSRIGSVRLYVEGQHKIPVGVQVYARGDDVSPALDVSFTQLHFTVPDNDNFTFSPPKGATVKQEAVRTEVPHRATAPERSALSSVQTFGTGWTTVVRGTLPAIAGAKGTAAGGADIAQALGSLQKVSGAWGTGRLFQSKLVCALLTDDGRVYVGAVDPSVLYATATAHR